MPTHRPSGPSPFGFLWSLALLSLGVALLTLPLPFVDAATDRYPFTVRFASGRKVTAKDLRIVSQCRRWATQTLDALPQAHTKGLSRLVLDLAPHYPDRARAGGNTMFLNCRLLSGQKNLTATLIHEMGHIVDASLLEGSSHAAASSFLDGSQPVMLDDSSVQFYTMSWKANDRRIHRSASGYVSRYAMTDPFEDFAETYTFYLLQGPAFRQLTANNSVLKAKYDFFRTQVFSGAEYHVSEPSQAALASYRPWDTTRLPYSLTSFLRHGNA